MNGNDAFGNFIDQIPSDIILKTEMHAHGNIIIFRPQSFIVGRDVLLEDYHILLPTSDPPPLKIGSKEHRFKKGKLIAFAPGIKMQCTQHAPTRQYIAMNIKKDFFQEIAREAVGKKELSFRETYSPYSSKLLSLISSFEEEIKNFRDSSDIMLQSIGTQIVIQILRDSGNDSAFAGKKLPSDKHYADLAIDYMMTYYNANIKIEDICNQIHLSPYYFIRMFKEKTGISPHEFLLSVRLTKAREMLLKNNYSIEEVSKQCGFVNTAHFSNYFKRIIGVPPSEYRRNH